MFIQLLTKPNAICKIYNIVSLQSRYLQFKAKFGSEAQHKSWLMKQAAFDCKCLYKQ